MVLVSHGAKTADKAGLDATFNRFCLREVALATALSSTLPERVGPRRHNVDAASSRVEESKPLEAAATLVAPAAMVSSKIGDRRAP